MSIGHKGEIERRIAHYRKLFLAFNQRKLEQILFQISPLKQDALHLVPVLLHLNLGLRRGPLGRCPADAPAGIRHLDKPPDLKALMGELLSGAPLPREAKWGRDAQEMPIRSLLLMGSLGSVAQTVRSDFDFWVIVDRRELGPKGEQDLTVKCQALEEWLRQAARAEATFFVTDITDVQSNRFGELGGESAGSALATLLKEEFYRSMTLLGGQVPWWWIMPPGATDQEYADIIAAMSGAIRVDSNAFVDMGPLGALDPREFFGASLWELQKSLDHPFKSVLKAALMEAYAHSPNDQELLAETLKRRVLEEDEKMPDSYLLMFDRVADHLTQADRKGDLGTVRTCLYLKGSPGLTSRDLADYKSLTGRKALFAAYVKNWGWASDKLEALNSYSDWPMSRRLALADEINKFMLAAFTRLARQLKSTPDSQAKIDPVDLTTVGRRLWLFFGSKPGRVAFLPNLLENPEPLRALTLCPLGRAKDSHETVWEAYEGQQDRSSPAAKLVRCAGLTHLLAWLSVNALGATYSHFYLVAGPSGQQIPVTLPEVQALFAAIDGLFGGLRHLIPKREDLVSPSRVTSLCLVPNLEQPPYEKELKTLSLLSQTSWGELYAQEMGQFKAGLAEVRRIVASAPEIASSAVYFHLPKRPTSARLTANLKSSLSNLILRPV